MTRNFEKELWEMVLRHPGKFEFKQMLVWQANEAITKKNINILYEPIATFHPDYPEDGVTHYSAEQVKKLVKNYGIEDYVKEVLEQR